MLKMRLDSLGFTYDVCDDVTEMENLGMQEAPMLENDGVFMNFVEAVMWLDQNNHKAGGSK